MKLSQKWQDQYGLEPAVRMTLSGLFEQLTDPESPKKAFTLYLTDFQKIRVYHRVNRNEPEAIIVVFSVLDDGKWDKRFWAPALYFEPSTNFPQNVDALIQAVLDNQQTNQVHLNDLVDYVASESTSSDTEAVKKAISTQLGNPWVNYTPELVEAPYNPEIGDLILWQTQDNGQTTFESGDYRLEIEPEITVPGSDTRRASRTLFYHQTPLAVIFENEFGVYVSNTVYKYDPDTLPAIAYFLSMFNFSSHEFKLDPFSHRLYRDGSVMQLKQDYEI